MKRVNLLKAICGGVLVLAAAFTVSLAKEGMVSCANLIYGGVKTAHCFSDEFLRLVETKTTIRTTRQFSQVRLLSDELYEYPFAIMTGQEQFALTGPEVERLRDYLTNGGFLLASSGCSESAWDQSFRTEIRRVFPDKMLTRLPFTHPLFHTVFDINALETKHSGTAFLEAIVLDERIVVVYSKEGLNDTAHKEGCCCCGGDEIRNSLQVNTNILAYVLTH